MGLPVATLTLFRFDRWRDRLWAFGQMALARRALRRLPGVGLVKLMGAGTGEGFTPLPDTGVVAILATFPDRFAAEAAQSAPVLARYHARASEALVLVLGTRASRGRWSGGEPFAAAPGAGNEATGPAGGGSGPFVVALTRATVRPRALLRFWARVPAISRRIGRDPAVLFKAGLGEVPWLHQVTVSAWPDVGAMDAFARREGAHAGAIRAVRAGDWFAEELYARFALLSHSGTWRGRDPFARTEPAPSPRRFAAE